MIHTLEHNKNKQVILSERQHTDPVGMSMLSGYKNLFRAFFFMDGLFAYIMYKQTGGFKNKPVYGFLILKIKPYFSGSTKICV